MYACVQICLQSSCILNLVLCSHGRKIKIILRNLKMKWTQGSWLPLLGLAGTALVDDSTLKSVIYTL